MTASNKYREMIKAYTQGQNAKALELARELVGQKLPRSKMLDVEHTIKALTPESNKALASQLNKIFGC